MANFFSQITISQTCVVAVLVRLAFMVYGEWQDANMVVKYTDIDYEVFTGAARYVSEGQSPYRRPTYRYTPILAMLLVPNITLHKAFGKLLFVFCDICAGYLIYMILKAQNIDRNSAVKFSCVWLFNPMIITVSTRGNAESMLAVLVLSTFYFMVEQRLTLSAIMLAFSVHFKIYPVIYALPLYLTVGWFARAKKASSQTQRGFKHVLFDYFCHLEQFKYAALSASMFLVLNCCMYYL